MKIRTCGNSLWSWSWNAWMQIKHVKGPNSKGPNYQRGVLLISAGAIEGYFQGNTPRKVHQVGFVLARQFPRTPGTWNPEENGLSGLPVSCPPTLILRIWPHHTTTCSLDWKTIEISPFFVRRGGHFCRGDLFGRTTFWKFFERLTKVRATG